uniref:Uncharacterized protein n=1 Tax=Anguilla anguilla TaxID=7936 RepID=A0A0E9WRW9_ANGAN
MRCHSRRRENVELSSHLAAVQQFEWRYASHGTWCSTICLKEISCCTFPGFVLEYCSLDATFEDPVEPLYCTVGRCVVHRGADMSDPSFLEE